jgi:hypothetical protein
MEVIACQEAHQRLLLATAANALYDALVRPLLEQTLGALSSAGHSIPTVRLSLFIEHIMHRAPRAVDLASQTRWV